MARSVLRQRIDRDLARYLIRGERLVHPPVRQHWVSQIVPLLVLPLTLALVLWVDASAPPSDGGRIAANAAWYVFFVVLLWFAWRIFNWRHDWFVATDKRFLLFEGFIRRRVSMMPLVKVTDLTFDRSLPGRLLGYGSFRLESAGQEQSLSRLDYLPHADRLYHDICTVLFGATGIDARPGRGWDDPDDPDEDDEDDDEPWDTPPQGPAGGSRPGPRSGPRAPSGTDPRAPVGDDDWLDPAYDDPAVRRYPEAHTSTARAAPVAISVRGESIYRSRDLDDTDEIPVVQARPMPTRGARRRRRPTGELPLYVPPDWSD